MFRYLNIRNFEFRNIDSSTFDHSKFCTPSFFVQLNLDITFQAIECGVTTYPGYGESCHR